MESLARLQGLHTDLIAFSEQRLANIDRLLQELEATVEDFRQLLDTPAPSTKDRDAYNSGKISVDEQEYGINDEFKHISRAIGTTLDLDEIEAGRLLIANQIESRVSTESFVTEAVSSFHNRRDLLLQTLRITLQQSLNPDLDEGPKKALEDIIAHILDIAKGPPSNGSLFAKKCIDALEGIEKLQAKISDALQSRSVLGGPRGSEFYATFEFQRDSLFKQHEALASILAYLFQGNYTISEDLRKVNNALKRWSRLDYNLIHYLPVFSSAFRQYGPPEGSASHEDSKSLDTVFGTMPTDPSTAAIRPFQAVLVMWWTVEHSGQYRDMPDQDSNSEKRANAIRMALKEDALEFLLSICTSTNTDVWRHPARQELVSLLLSECSGLSIEQSDQTSSYFRVQLMESLENFVEAFITNMPDSIRRLKSEEDDQRLHHLSAMQDGAPPDPRGGTAGKLHLECFLVLISFAFEQRPEAAEQWWEDPDSNLYGFLQWGSTRQTVPRVSAFCELLCSISEDQDSAEAAHKFLLDDSLPAPPRGRRNPSMNYQQIFAELELYASKVHERSTTTQLPNARKNVPTDMNELESPVMLSCYLRLLAHLCRQPSSTRTYILETVTPALPQSLLVLSSGPVPSYLRASVFAMLDALLTDKTLSTASAMWHLLDDWAANGQEMIRSTVTKTAQPPKPSSTTLQNTLNSLALSFDQYDAMVVLLRDLVTTMPSTGITSDLLPFPSDLGSSYRSPGISPYVDFICGQVFTKRIPELVDETQRLIGSFHCLEFVAVGLEGFNEDYIAMLDRSTTRSDANQQTPSAAAYAQRSPFARLMQWLLSVDMNKLLLESLRVPVDSIDAALPNSPLLLSVQRSIDIINLVLDLQPTYFDIVKPLIPSQSTPERHLIKASVPSIEDAIIAHPEVVLSLCQLAATSHSDMALRALALLQKLSSSAKLNNHFTTAESSRGRARRIVDSLGPTADFELESVADNITSRLQIDVRELEDGFESVGYLIKDGILAFFNASLETQPDLPNVAHLLLGFKRLNERLTISDKLDQGTAVFNAIIDLVQDYPSDDAGVFLSWLLHLKTAAIRVLQHLWSGSLSSSIVVGQLRRLQMLQTQLMVQPIVSHQTLWDGNPVLHPEFWYTTSAEALAEFLFFRAALYQYVRTELKAASRDGLSTTLRQSFSTLQGKTQQPDRRTATHTDVFALFDFLELDFSRSFELDLHYYHELDVEMYMTEAADNSPSLYNVNLVREWLNAYKADVLHRQIEAPGAKQVDEEDLISEADGILATIEARNRSIIALSARKEALREYIEMVIAIIECCPMDATEKLQFIQRILQIMLPKLDALIAEESDDVTELARAAEALLLSLAETPRTYTHLDNLVTERLFQLFRASIEGIPMSNTSTMLRGTLYSICLHYLGRIMSSATDSDSNINSKARRNSMDCVRSASQRLIQILCDDAEDGLDTCRLNAINLLALLTSLARTEKSPFVLNSFIKANVLEILIEPLKHVAEEFQITEPANRPYLLSIFEGRMLLLLQISRTREGAGALLDAGFTSAVRDSLLFKADPDLGIAIPVDADSSTYSVMAANTNSALHTYYVLVASTLRVLLSVYTNRGAQNEQIQYLARAFLTEHRPNMVGVFKKYAGVSGKIDERIRPLVAESVRCYTGLITLCGFVDYEDASNLDTMQTGGFS